VHRRALPWLATIVGLGLIAVACNTSEAEPRAPSSPTPSASPSVDTTGSPDAFDADALETTWTDWLAQAEKDTGVARQMLRKSLATPIAVRPAGKGVWTFGGFTRLDEVLAGGVGRRLVVSELRDSGTAALMIGYLTPVLAQGGSERPGGPVTLLDFSSATPACV